jgi:hypothetical protein
VSADGRALGPRCAAAAACRSVCERRACGLGAAPPQHGTWEAVSNHYCNQTVDERPSNLSSRPARGPRCRTLVRRGEGRGTCREGAVHDTVCSTHTYISAIKPHSKSGREGIIQTVYAHSIDHRGNRESQCAPSPAQPNWEVRTTRGGLTLCAHTQRLWRPTVACSAGCTRFVLRCERSERGGVCACVCVCGQCP